MSEPNKEDKIMSETKTIISAQPGWEIARWYARDNEGDTFLELSPVIAWVINQEENVQENVRWAEPIGLASMSGSGSANTA
jgi:hypothetical protein